MALSPASCSSPSSRPNSCSTPDSRSICPRTRPAAKTASAAGDGSRNQGRPAAVWLIQTVTAIPSGTVSRPSRAGRTPIWNGFRVVPGHPATRERRGGLPRPPQAPRLSLLRRNHGVSPPVRQGGMRRARACVPCTPRRTTAQPNPCPPFPKLRRRDQAREELFACGLSVYQAEFLEGLCLEQIQL